MAFLTIKQCVSQDIHFSQNNLAPTTVNPASTGDFNGSFRVGNIYRRQWASISTPFITNALTYDQSIYQNISKLSGGVSVIYDRSGDLQYTDAEIYLSTSYQTPIFNSKHKLSFGLQPGITIKSISQNNLSLPNQFDFSQGTFNPDLPTNDILTNNQKSSFIANTGISWSYTTSKFNSNLGFSVFNITQSGASFFNNKEQTPVRLNPSANFTFNFDNNFFINPSLQYQFQRGATSSIIGTNVGYMFKKNAANLKSVYAGAMVRTGFSRNTDAVIPNLGMRIHNFDIGVAYDVNRSSLKSATGGRGAFEIAIIYTQFYQLLSKITPTCERM